MSISSNFLLEVVFIQLLVGLTTLLPWSEDFSSANLFWWSYRYSWYCSKQCLQRESAV